MPFLHCKIFISLHDQLIYRGGFRRKRKRRQIDYNEEIPFEKQPPPGFHDISEDTDDLVPQNFKRLRHQDVMGERRDDLERVSEHTVSG